LEKGEEFKERNKSAHRESSNSYFVVTAFLGRTESYEGNEETLEV